VFKGIAEHEVQETIEDILDRFNLLHRKDADVKDLSGGQKRKVQLAIALLGNA